MNSKSIGTNREGVWTRLLARLEGMMRPLIWLLACVLAAMLAAFLWILARGHGLDADMDVVAASLRGA